MEEDSGSEESHMDDVSGSEAEEMLPMRIGSEAEVRSDDPGFVGSFYEATVIRRYLTSRGRGYYTVRYSRLVTDDQRPLEETAAAADVRPRPPGEESRREFSLYEAVEAFQNDGWWAGIVSAVLPPVAGVPRKYQVALPTSRETVEFEETDLRSHRVYQAQAGCWVPASEVVSGIN